MSEGGQPLSSHKDKDEELRFTHKNLYPGQMSESLNKDRPLLLRARAQARKSTHSHQRMSN